MAKDSSGNETTDTVQTEEERLAAEQVEADRIAAEEAAKKKAEEAAAAKAEQDRLDDEELVRLEAEEAAAKKAAKKEAAVKKAEEEAAAKTEADRIAAEEAAKAEQLANEAAELAKLIDDSGELSLSTLPDTQLSVHCKAIKDYVTIVSKAIPNDNELMRLNSRLRDNIYGILDDPDSKFAAMQLRTVVNILSTAPRYVFDTSLTFQFLNKFRWKRDMRREYECLLNTISKMRYWKTEADADNYAWETFKATMRIEKSEAYTRTVFASMGLEA